MIINEETKIVGTVQRTNGVIVEYGKKLITWM
jgi:hypothetical protein